MCYSFRKKNKKNISFNNNNNDIKISFNNCFQKKKEMKAKLNRLIFNCIY